MSTVSVPAPLGVAWAVGLAVLATVFPWGGGLRRLTGDRALAYEKGKRRPADPAPVADGSAETIQRLDGPDAIPIGTDGAGRLVKLRGETAFKSALILGASGSGKSRWLLAVLRALIVSMVTGRPFEVEVVDAKNETVDLLRQVIGFWLLTWPEEWAAWLRRHVRINLFDRDRVTPIRQYDNAGSGFTDAFTASFRTAVTIDAGTADYTDSTRHAREMLDRVLTDLRWPLSAPVAIRFYGDPAFQAAVAARVRDGHLRSYIQTLAATVTKATAAAVCRRVDREMSDPHVRAAKGVPPAALDRLLPTQEPGLTLSRVGPDRTLTPTVAQQLCLYRYFDLLASVTARSPERPLLLVAEELAATVAGSPRLVTPLAQALRTSRSFGVGLWAAAQDLESTAQAEMARGFALNARFIVAFQSRGEADLLAPHLPEDFAPGGSDAERRRAFQREMEGLPPRSFFLWCKGERALRCRSLDAPDPAAEAGRSAAELTEVFDREIGSRSTISLEAAEGLIAAFEAEVLGRREVAAAPDAKAAPRFESMDDLLRHLETDEDDVDG